MGIKQVSVAARIRPGSSLCQVFEMDRLRVLQS